MITKEFITALIRALPFAITKEESIKLNGFVGSQFKDRLVYDFLRIHPKINWNQYLLNYSDLNDLNIDPIEHFITDGLFEGRKLQLQENIIPMEHEYKISIIIPSYNKENT